MFHNVEIQNTKGLCLNVNTLEILKTKQRAQIHNCQQDIWKLTHHPGDTAIKDVIDSQAEIASYIRFWEILWHHLVLCIQGKNN